MSRTRPDAIVRVIFAVVALAGLVQSLSVGISVVGRYTSEDHELLQVAALDWAARAVPEPAFYGQAYGTTFESIAIAIASAWGLDAHAALTTLAALTYWIGWLVVGLIALKARRPVAALVAMSAPILISTDYLLQSTFSCWFVGPLLAIVMAGMYLSSERRIVRLIALTIGLLGSVWAPSALILFAPFAAHYCAQILSKHRGKALVREITFTALVAVPGLAWLGFVNAFYQSHPEFAFHPDPGSLSLANFGHTMLKVQQVFSPLAPELANSFWVIAGLVVIVTIFAVAQRRLTLALPAVALILVTLAAAASPRASEAFSLFSGMRLFFLLPLGLWVVWYWAAERFPVNWSARVVVSILLALVTVSVGTLVVRASTIESNWTQRTGEIQAITVMSVAELERQCDVVEQIQAETGATVFAFLENKATTYGCQAIIGDGIRTVYPEYDRRTLLLKQLAVDREPGIVVIGSQFDACRYRDGDRIEGCSAVSGFDFDGTRAVYVESQGETVLELLTRLGVALRPL